MTTDDFEIEWRMPSCGLRLVYPIECTKNKTAIFDFDFGGYPGEDNALMDRVRSAPSVACRITIKEHLGQWAYETFGYVPQLEVLTNVNLTAAAYLLKFANEADSMLFRIRFGHLF